MTAPALVNGDASTAVGDLDIVLGTVTGGAIQAGDLIVLCVAHDTGAFNWSINGSASSVPLLVNNALANDGVGRQVSFWYIIVTAGNITSFGTQWTFAFNSGSYGGTQRRIIGQTYRHARGWNASQKPFTGAMTGHTNPQATPLPVVSIAGCTVPCVAVMCWYSTAGPGGAITRTWDASGGGSGLTTWGTTNGLYESKLYDDNTLRTSEGVQIAGFNGSPVHALGLIVFSTRPPTTSFARGKTYTQAHATPTVIRRHSGRGNAVSKAPGIINIGVFSANGRGITTKKARGFVQTVFPFEGRGRTQAQGIGFNASPSFFRSGGSGVTWTKTRSEGHKYRKGHESRGVTVSKAHASFTLLCNARGVAVSKAHATGTILRPNTARGKTVTKAHATPHKNIPATSRGRSVSKAHAVAHVIRPRQARGVTVTGKGIAAGHHFLRSPSRGITITKAHGVGRLITNVRQARGKTVTKAHAHGRVHVFVPPSPRMPASSGTRLTTTSSQGGTRLS